MQYDSTNYLVWKAISDCNENDRKETLLMYKNMNNSNKSIKKFHSIVPNWHINCILKNLSLKVDHHEQGK